MLKVARSLINKPKDKQKETKYLIEPFAEHCDIVFLAFYVKGKGTGWEERGERGKERRWMCGCDTEQKVLRKLQTNFSANVDTVFG